MTKNQIVFSRVQRVNVRRCQLSVMFKQLWFVSFGHIQTDFQLYQFGQVNYPPRNRFVFCINMI